MVGVSCVFRVHFPVVGQHFNKPADDLYLPAAEDAVEASQNVLADEVLN